MKKAMSVALILLILISLVGCGGGNDLIGKWQIDLEEYDENNSLGIDLSITFTEEKWIMMGMEFDYEIKGDKIVVQLFGAEPEEINYKINGDKLKLFIEGEETNFVRVKD